MSLIDNQSKLRINENKPLHRFVAVSWKSFGYIKQTSERPFQRQRFNCLPNETLLDETQIIRKHCADLKLHVV